MDTLTVDDVSERYLTIWDGASRDVRRAGRSWYPTTRRIVREIAAESGLSFSAVAGIVAALSPRKPWEQNIDVARAAAIGEWEHVSQTGANVDKAFRIARGERPLAVLGGSKVRAFYRALMGDRNAAVIDTWMMQAAGWHRDGVTSRQYAMLAQALIECAMLLGVTVLALQAAIWLAVRGR